jgi:hypothetical protein
VGRLSGIELVVLQESVILDDLTRLSGKDPEVPLLHTDATVATSGGLDLGHLSLEDEGATMAVASVFLGGLSHGYLWEATRSCYGE